MLDMTNARHWNVRHKSTKVMLRLALGLVCLGSFWAAHAESIPTDSPRWHLEITGAQAKLYVNAMREPSLVMNDLKSGIRKGGVGLAGVYFSNFEIRETPPVAWERHEPAMPAATITKWSLSPSLDALARDLEGPLSKSEGAAMKWQDVTAEPPGFVVINRYRSWIANQQA